MDRVTLAADLGSDIFSTDVDQNYIVMGSVNDEYDISHQKETGNTPPIGVMA